MSRRRDAGSGTVMALAVLMVAWVFAALALALGQVAALRHHAGSAADLAALAAASRMLEGPAAACDEAAQVAGSYQATLVRCVVTDATVDVAVSVRARGRLAALGAMSAHARAGPVGVSRDAP